MANSPVKRVLPKITLQDIDWKLVVLLGFLILITWGDDITGIGEIFDPVEIVIDAIVAYVIGTRAMQSAASRETVVEGKVVENAPAAPVASSPVPVVVEKKP